MPQVAGLIEAREKARQAKDFVAADALRAELQSMGIDLIDGPSGTAWKKIPVTGSHRCQCRVGVRGNPTHAGA